MINRKLLELIRLLDKAEIRKLRHFLQSPYFTSGLSSQEILKLFEYLVRTPADDHSPLLDKQRVSETLFPDKDFVPKGKNPIDTLTTDLLRLIRKFVFIQSVETDTAPAMQELPLARLYRRAGMEERFWQTINHVRETCEQQTRRSGNYYLDQYRIEEEVMAFKSVYFTTESDANTLAGNYYLDRFYLLHKMEIFCSQAYYNFIAGKCHNDDDLGPLLFEAVRQGKFADEPIARLFLLAHDLIGNPRDDKRLETFEALLQQHLPNIPAPTDTNLLSFQRNFIMYRYLGDNSPATLTRYFDLLLEHLYDGHLFFEGQLRIATYRNIVHMSLRLGRPKEAKKALDRFPPERICGTRYPNEVWNLLYAEYYLATGDYAQCEAKLTYAAFEPPLLRLQADLLLIKVYYETENDLLYARLSALAQKTRRANIAEAHKRKYLDFLLILEKIIRNQDQNDRAWKAALLAEINTARSPVEREWLLKQVNKA